MSEIIERKSFKDFVVEVANIHDENYDRLSELPEDAKSLLLAIPPELDPWDLLNQAQVEQGKLEARLALLEELVGECKNDLVNINQLMVGLDSWQTISGCLNAIIQKISFSIQKKGGV